MSNLRSRTAFSAKNSFDNSGHTSDTRFFKIFFSESPPNANAKSTIPVSLKKKSLKKQQHKVC